MKEHAPLIIIGLGIAIAVTSLFVLRAQDRALVRAIKSGELILTCEFATGELKQIDPVKLEDYREGRFYFTNGSAVSCTVK